MQAGRQGEELLRVMAALRAELGGALDPDDPPAARSQLGEEGLALGVLDSEDEGLVADLRRSLAGLAADLSPDAETADSVAVRATLDGMEVVTRGELICGNRERLPQLLPGFVFLVALPIVGQDRALELSRRTTALVASA